MNEILTLNIPVFYACTAASLDGPPLEIAWAALAVEAHETHGAICGSHLICPDAVWISDLARDPSALQPYGLALSDLRDFGTPPPELATHMNETLAGRELFPALPEDDACIRWIFDSAKMAPEFVLGKSDADELIAELARLRRLPHATTGRAKREAAAMCLTGIRAEAKARFLATYWGLVAGRN